MRRADVPSSSISLFLPPYQTFSPVVDIQNCTDRGVAVVWRVGAGQHVELSWLADRPASVALVIVLPPPEVARQALPLLREATSLRPRGVLPNSGASSVETVRLLLGGAPRDLANMAVAQFADHGILRSQRIRGLVTKIFEFAPTVPSITHLARKLYTSRRTMGRQFEAENLPVPSHWLQFARLLYVSAMIQDRQDMPIFRAATAVGYPDGFTMSNQMKRLIGCRPSDVREHLGLNWIIEEWITRERDARRMEWPGMYARREDIDEWLKRNPLRRSA